jgi:hypothetical protein
MHVDLRLDRPAARTAFRVALIVVCAWLSTIVLCNFLVDALSDPRMAVTPDAPMASFITDPFDRGGANPAVLAAAVRYIPNSPRLHLKLAETETNTKHSYDLRAAENHATRAIQLSPYDYKPRLLLASIHHDNSDWAAAEQAIRATLKLAPHNVQAHYILGSLLLGQKSIAESSEEFRTAIAGYPPYLRPALNLLWTETEGNAGAVEAATPDTPEDRLTLSSFLLEKLRPLESADVFRKIDHDVLLADPNSAQYLDRLIATGHVRLAYELWRDLVGRPPVGFADSPPQEGENNHGGIWNGGFENDILVNFSQFDWSIQPSQYAKVSIDTAIAHSGSRSLRVDFLGHETTRLGDEIKQILLLRQGARYRVQYYFRTQDLGSPEGAQVVITTKGSNEWIAASAPAPQGTNDWQQGTLEFTASDDMLLLSIRQKPKFSYEGPTLGTIWFDDFDIRQIGW